MAATVTNRNFTGGNNSSQTNKKKRSSSLLGVFIFTLIFLAVILLFSAIYLSRQLDLNHNPQQQQQQQHRNDNAPAVSDISTNNIKRGSNGGNNDIRNKQSITNTVQQKPPTSPPLLANNYNNKMIPKYKTSFRNFSSFKAYPNDRLYCMIPFIWNPKIYSAIMNTWGQRCDTIHFLTDAMVQVDGEINGDHISFDTATTTTTRPYWEFPDGTFPPNVKFINMTRSWEDCPSTTNRRTGKLEKKVCRHIWEKMWRSWIYVDKHHIHDAEWFCKVDYDTFFFPDNLRYYVHDVKQWNGINEYHYFGHVIQHRSRKDRPMVVGASACWSRKTLHDIADVYRNMPKGSTRGERGKCEDRAHATEEVTTSQCLKDHLNIDPEPARDENQREYITIDKYPLVLGWNRTEQGEWWYWRGKPANAGQTENTIARRPIGIHKYKSAVEILRLWEEFYGPSEDDLGGNAALTKVGQDRKHGKVAKKFVLEVRKAMGIDP